LLTATLTLAACSHFEWFPKASPPAVELAPSTFCTLYEPVNAPGDRGGAEWAKFWDDLQKNYPDQYETIRRNNNRWLFACVDVDPPTNPV